ncbi:DUF664 domain-containing protein [Pseudonocardia sp. ICBG601]|uniref:mycothiol transferase n=1 Tax=Pseudonocardia sp. ICBG601 TaxID=2846759 RepID=UPI0027E34B1C|nr:DUF664 domain-containing protein [Pseudonocardia sp. ICBG601]
MRPRTVGRRLRAPGRGHRRHGAGGARRERAEPGRGRVLRAPGVRPDRALRARRSGPAVPAAAPAPGPRLPEPSDPAPSTTALLLGYVDFYRDRVLDKYAALPEPERTASRLPSGWSPAELLHHLRCMERRWLEWGFVDADLPDPWADHVDGLWALPSGDGADDVAAALAAQGRRTREIAESVGPGAAGVPSGRWAGAPPATIERTLLHVVQEYARHLGHLDVVVELATGSTGE